jgi:hypothetical protein
MNPRGRQYALGGTVSGWTRLEDPTPRQRRLLRSTYRGLNPRTYGRYGRHQWRGPLPGTRLVVKDPFAMLSTPTIAAVTGAVPIQVYRHPGAVLASYRRMGWQPDLDEIGSLVPEAARHRPELAELYAGGGASLGEAARMGLFWAVLQVLLLDDLPQVPQTLVVAHGELAAGGVGAAEALFDRLGLVTTEETRREMRGGGPTPAPAAGSGLHQLNRNPAEVAQSWRRHLDAQEVAEIEKIAGPVLAELEERRFTW